MNLLWIKVNRFHLLEYCFIFVKISEKWRKMKKNGDSDIVENKWSGLDTLKIPTKIS
jgi:hypothetical protein